VTVKQGVPPADNLVRFCCYVRAVITRSLAYPHGRDLPREITRLIAGPCEEPQGRSTGNLTDRGGGGGGSDERTRSQYAAGIVTRAGEPAANQRRRRDFFKATKCQRRRATITAPAMLTTTRPTTFRRTTAYLTRLVSRELSAAAAYLRLLPRSIPPARRVRVRRVRVRVGVVGRTRWSLPDRSRQ